MTRLRWLLPALLLAAPSAMAGTAAPVNAACAVVEISSPQGKDADFNQRLFQVNRVVAEGASRTLLGDGYTVHTFEEQIFDPTQRLTAVSQQLGQTGCTEVIEISNLITPDTLTFKAMAFHLARQNAISVTVVGDYAKSYAYPLTQDTLDHLSMSNVGETMAHDMEAAGLLAKTAK